MALSVQEMGQRAKRPQHKLRGCLWRLETPYLKIWVPPC